MEYRFANVEWLQFLWLVPVLYFLIRFFYRRQRRQIEKNLSSRLAPFLLSSVSDRKRHFKILLEILTLALMVLALARPQSGESKQKVKSEGVEIMLLVDVSNSMMAEDVRPSRLDLAKKELSRFLDLVGGDKVGVIAFAGSAVLLSPVTSDKAALKMFLESLSAESVSSQGTEFKSALEEARQAFERGGAQVDNETVVTRVIVIASDGEDNEPGAIETAEALAKAGVRIFSLGFGTEKGAPIPIRDDQGNLRGYRKDQQGKTIMTKTKGTVLKSLAKTGKGSFHHITLGGGRIKKLNEEIERLEKTEFENAELVDYGENYQVILFFALIFGLLEVFLGERRSVGRIWKGRFEVSEQ